MDLSASISTIMQTDLVSVSSQDPMQKVKETLENFNIRHLPVIDNDVLVGLISHTDLLHFMEIIDENSREFYLNKIRLKNYKVSEVMTKELITANTDDSIEKVLRLIYNHDFHAVPIMEQGELKGIVTTHDVLRFILKDA